jgi:hypothetical protein
MLRVSIWSDATSNMTSSSAPVSATGWKSRLRA